MSEMHRQWPRIKLRGTDLLNRIGVIYTQNLCDLLMKIDDGTGTYPKGFLHTSTTPDSVPNYYHQMWSRDVGRGIMELVRAGFLTEAQIVEDCIFQYGMTYGDHFGRTIETGLGDHEVDGNINLLLAFYSLWRYSGSGIEKGQKLLNQVFPIFTWLKSVAERAPYDYLMPCKSEMSGNPDTEHFIFAVFASYGALAACEAYAELARTTEDSEKQAEIEALYTNLKRGLKKWLISRGQEGDQDTKTPPGVWLNGIDERTGKAAEEGDFGPKFDIHRWTRQLPFIMDYDIAHLSVANPDSDLEYVNRRSYQYIKEGMCEGYFFRRYGFVSNTCFAGVGGRHDDTMAGYGQNYFTQAALLCDDVNVYTKCIDGIARLAYDGDVVEPLTLDLNPWVMHECFCYPNYESGKDHTFGVNGDESRKIMHNPGDEGNLVQAAETLKTISMIAGITAQGKLLFLCPRLPWECSKAIVEDFPVPSPGNRIVRISYELCVDREENLMKLTLDGAGAFQELFLRLGPLPNLLFAEKEIEKEWTIERQFEAVFVSRRQAIDADHIEILLKNRPV